MDERKIILGKPKQLQIGDMVYWSSGDDLGMCGAPGCGEKAFSYNEDGNLFCESCLEDWHESVNYEEDYPEACSSCGRMEDWCECDY